jgi:hypothetical protein
MGYWRVPARGGLTGDSEADEALPSPDPVPWRRSGVAAMGALVGIDIVIGRVIVNVRSTGVVVVRGRQRRRRPVACRDRVECDIRSAAAVGSGWARPRQDEAQNEGDEPHGDADRNEGRPSEVALLARWLHGHRNIRFGVGPAFSHAALGSRAPSPRLGWESTDATLPREPRRRPRLVPEGLTRPEQGCSTDCGPDEAVKDTAGRGWTCPLA